jgi:hypothetical protein
MDSGESAGTRIPVRIKLVHRAGFVLQRTSFAFELIKHVPAVVTVFAAGMSALQSERDGGALALAAAELLTGAWVLFVVGREAWHLFGRGTANAFAQPDPHAAHKAPRIDSANLAAAALGFVESWHRTHVTGHFKLISPQIVGATTSLLLALGGQRAIRRRREGHNFYVEVTPAEMRYKAGPRTSWRANWTDVAEITHAPDQIAVRLQNGRRRVLRADTFFDGDAVITNTRAAIAAFAPEQLTAGAVTPSRD